jgi:hypothetical protein
VNDLIEAFAALEEQLPPIAVHLAEPSRAITPVGPSDPSRLGYPPTFPIEIALKTSSTQAICEAYGISRDEWDRLRYDTLFLGDLERAMKLVSQEGMSFKLKAKLQAEELLKTSWRTIHDPLTPPSVKADLIKSTMRWAEYDQPPKESALAGAAAGFSINIQLNNQPA